VSHEGSAFAMVGAYTLAGEFRFTAYERKFRPLLELKQKSARSSHPVSCRRLMSDSVFVIWHSLGKIAADRQVVDATLA
jgi:hypothetical protein